MKTTPFTRYHIEAGAKMAPFAGFNMPIEFSGIADEHKTVREGVGIFDVSHMGEIWVKGPNAFAFLQYVTSNDISALFDGKVQYSCYPNGKGGIVDDLLVYRVNAETYLLVVNASNTDKDYNHMASIAPKFGIIPGKNLYNASDEIAQLAIQGPKAMELVQELCEDKVTDMQYYTFCKTNVAGIKDAILSITGYTGAGGCEIYVANEDAEKLWSALWEKGEKYGLKNIGLGARDTLRLEMGFCLYGNDIDDTTSPIEAGLGWITKFNADKDFIDKELLLSQKTNGTKKKLVGFEMVDRGIARHGYDIVDSQGGVIGHVTSGTQSPSLRKAVGLGYVDTKYSNVGSEIYIPIRGKNLKAVVVRPPFYKQ